MTRKMQPYKILVVDDSADTREVIQTNLEEAGYQVFTSPNVTHALAAMEKWPIDMVITDLKMPKISGMELVRHVRQNFSDVEVMMITGYPSIEGAVEAVKTGAEHYLVKPFTDQELLAAVQAIVAKLERKRAKPAKPRTMPTFGIIGTSPAMRKVFQLIQKAAAAPATVLICGESGTGKELVARAVHYAGPRRSAPFVSVNCTAIPENLIESELFGHVRGAFTGALEGRAGFFQIADGGTLFLDEIGDASWTMQGKLLRVIQDKTIYKVGSSQAIHVNTRLIVATNKDLPQLVQKGLFREDLYYRLNVVDIPVPPLRERGDDVFALIHYFLEKFSQDLDRPAPRFNDEALRRMRTYAWPGNVRELENLIQKLVIITDGDTIQDADLPAAMRFRIYPEKRLDQSLAEFETDYIREVLTSVGGNKTKAAEILKIDRKTLRERLK